MIDFLVPMPDPSSSRTLRSSAQLRRCTVAGIPLAVSCGVAAENTTASVASAPRRIFESHKVHVMAPADTVSTPKPAAADVVDDRLAAAA